MGAEMNQQYNQNDTQKYPYYEDEDSRRSGIIVAYGICVFYGMAIGIFIGWLIWAR